MSHRNEFRPRLDHRLQLQQSQNIRQPWQPRFHNVRHFVSSQTTDGNNLQNLNNVNNGSNFVINFESHRQAFGPPRPVSPFRNEALLPFTTQPTFRLQPNRPPFRFGRNELLGRHSLVLPPLPPHIHDQPYRAGIQPSQFAQPPTVRYPPPIPSLSSSFPQQQLEIAACNVDTFKDDLETQKEMLKDKVEQWLKRKCITSRKEKDSSSLLKIHEYQAHMRTYILKLEKLRHLNDVLAERMEADHAEWEQLTQAVREIKNDVSSLQKKLFCHAQVDFIENLVKSRRRRRDRLRRKRRRQKEEYITSLAESIKWNETIDEWQNKEQRKHLMEKIDENLKNEAGESLVEVKRKQHDTAEFLTIFNKLKQLREVRKKTAIFKGILVTEKDDAGFNSKVKEIENLLMSQMKIYEDEERALRVLREEEAEEINRKEKEKQNKRKQSRRDDLHVVDPLFFFRSYWLQAEDSIPSFIHVRSLWDFYLCPPDCPDGSTIPKGMVKPSELNKDWKKVLSEQRSS